MLGLLFPLSLFLSAVLLFSIQPMVAKALLPIYGGTPAVWTVCMIFFQTIMLLSYGYVWGLSFLKTTKQWRLVHALIALIGLISLPQFFQPLLAIGIPEWSILSSLLLQLGLPLLVIGASAPLLQFAYSQTTGKRAADPYFLYAASNFGSLISLLAYPWLIERYLGLSYQFQLWRFGYYAYLILLATVLIAVRYKPLSIEKKQEETTSCFAILRWVFFSFVPCSLMLGVTLYITTDVAATPLFWVLPLALYLLTFVITFRQKPLISNVWLTRNCLFFLIFSIVGFILGTHTVHVVQLIFFNLLCFFMLALLCHGQLYRYRPKAEQLTLFYFCLAIGGVLAGIFNGIIAPHLFNQIYEYPLALALSLLVLPLTKKVRYWLPVLVLFIMLLHYALPAINLFMTFSSLQYCALLALILIVVFYQSKVDLFLAIIILFSFIFYFHGGEQRVLLQQRNFYGVKQVLDKTGVHVVISQSTVHGLQDMNGEQHLNGFTSYYGAIKPVVELLHQQFKPLTVTIIGLGAGTMVCQFKAQDTVQVVEIDEQMIALAENSALFTYLRDCPAQAKIIKEDGRIALSRLKDDSQNLIIMDAFNSDAIPTHLVTLEAFKLYQHKLASNGVILVNLSNRHLQLLPVINAMGRALNLMVFHVVHKGDAKLGQFNSEWALLTDNESLVFQLMAGNSWQFVADSRQYLWTDDYSNIIPLLKWQ